MSFDPYALRLAPIFTALEVRAIEETNASAPLMQRAGLAAATVAQDMLGRSRSDANGQVLVLAGPGNNGGDAFVLAHHLREWFFDVTVVFAGTPSSLPPHGVAAAALRAFVDGGGALVTAPPLHWRGGLIVDGIFGIGLKRPPAPPYLDWIAWANAASTPVLALDIPSGLNADTGIASGAAILATATSTFIGLKPGLLTGDGPDLCGCLHVHPLGLEDTALAEAVGHRLEWSALAATLPEALHRRRKNVHKGTFGTLGIIGGAAGMLGAPLLGGRAALRAGAGRVRVGFAAHAYPQVDLVAPELMVGNADEVLDSGADVLVTGPGLGVDARGGDLLRRALALSVPLVLDADALNLLAREASSSAALRSRAPPTLLTPHPAEAGRLLGISTQDVQADRLHACKEMARRFNAHVVLKGAGSVLCAPDGRWDINTSGNSGLSVAGTGDVLAGFAGAMLAQGLSPRTALRYAVCLHGAAADALVEDGHGPVGLMASEIADAARGLLNGASHSARMVE